MPSLLNEILTAAEAITQADVGSVQLVEASTGALRIQADHGFSEVFVQFFSRVHKNEAASCGNALARRQRIFVEDIEKSPIFAGTPALDIMRGEGVRAVQSTPIVSRAGVIIGISTHISKHVANSANETCACSTCLRA